jgi:thioredoxin reductase (NADPH)
VGQGGISSGIYAMRATLKTALIEMSAPGGQVSISAEVENYPGFESINGAELSLKMLQHARSVDLEIRNDQAMSVEPGLNYHTIKLASGETHAVIIATGGHPIRLDIPGEDTNFGNGVSYCAVYDGFFFKDKIVMVVGGGDSAVEEALYLAKFACKVYIVHRRNELRASKILQQRAFNECNIEILWNTVPTDIIAGEVGVRAVRLKDTQTVKTSQLEIDGVFIFICSIPNNQIVPAGVKMNADRYVMTDEKCETSLPGIYAIGDHREKYARQILTAAADGCTASLSAAHYVETKKDFNAICDAPIILLETGTG